MSSRSIFRLSSLAAMTGGALSIIFIGLSVVQLAPAEIDNPRAMASLLLWLFGVMGIYGYQHHKAGILGLVGFILAVISLVMNICFRYVVTFFVPELQGNYPQALTTIYQGPVTGFIMLVFLLFLVGFVLFGVGALRTGIFSRWPAWLVILGAILSYAATLFMLPPVSMLGTGLLAAGLFWFGAALWSASSEAIAVARPTLAA